MHNAQEGLGQSHRKDGLTGEVKYVTKPGKTKVLTDDVAEPTTWGPHSFEVVGRESQYPSDAYSSTAGCRCQWDSGPFLSQFQPSKKARHNGPRLFAKSGENPLPIRII